MSDSISRIVGAVRAKAHDSAAAGATSTDDLEKLLRNEIVRDGVHNSGEPLTDTEIHSLAMAELAGFGSLQPFLDDPSIEEIWINSPTQVFVARYGVAELTAYLATRMPEGELLYPAEMITETPDSVWIAELVREQLLENTHEELPYSIATRVTEYEPPRIRCEIVVERESQKGMVIGKNGAMLKIVGTNVRRQLPSGTFLELAVVVDKNWQQRPERVERLGY